VRVLVGDEGEIKLSDSDKRLLNDVVVPVHLHRTAVANVVNMLRPWSMALSTGRVTHLYARPKS
jgi:hypothetical protein